MASEIRDSLNVLVNMWGRMEELCKRLHGELSAIDGVPGEVMDDLENQIMHWRRAQDDRHKIALSVIPTQDKVDADEEWERRLLGNYFAPAERTPKMVRDIATLAPHWCRT